MAPPATARAKLDAYGIDQFCEDICAGKTQAEIAEAVGVSEWALIDWKTRDPERSARAQAVIRMMAQSWAEKAQKAIETAGDGITVQAPIDLELKKFELARARELASHLRWRAAVGDPKNHGGKADWPDDPGSQPDVAGQIAEGADPVEASRLYADIVGGK